MAINEPSGLAEASSRTTVEEAEEQHPGLDTSKPAASEETPSGDDVVLAQTPEEVEAQYVNAAGGGAGERTEEGDANAEDAGEEDAGGGQYDSPAALESDGDGDGISGSGGADADSDGFADTLEANDAANEAASDDE